MRYAISSYDVAKLKTISLRKEEKWEFSSEERPEMWVRKANKFYDNVKDHLPDGRFSIHDHRLLIQCYSSDQISFSPNQQQY